MDKNINIELEAVACPICDSKKSERVSSRGYMGLPCFVSICQNDGMVFLNPRWKKERYQHFYQHEYDLFYRPEVLANEPEDLKYQSIREIVARISESGEIPSHLHSVLDVGAGMGWSLCFLKSNYAQFKYFSAVESSVFCLRNLKDLVGANIIAANAEEEWKEDVKYDLILMRHVFEHFLDLKMVMKNVSEHLSENGIIYVEVPDMMNPCGSLYDYWFRNVHTYYFSRDTLFDVMSKSGFVAVKQGAENANLWGIFKKSASTDVLSEKFASEITFHQQKKVIKFQKRMNFLFELTEKCRFCVKKALPSRLIEIIRSMRRLIGR